MTESEKLLSQMSTSRKPVCIILFLFLCLPSLFSVINSCSESAHSHPFAIAFYSSSYSYYIPRERLQWIMSRKKDDTVVRLATCWLPSICSRFMVRSAISAVWFHNFLFVLKLDESRRAVIYRIYRVHHSNQRDDHPLILGTLQRPLSLENTYVAIIRLLLNKDI